MKPEYLKLSAWGPFRDEAEVDFTKLGQRGLFLISGPTGAGKTTIFDALSFALFGRVSGDSREKESVRSDFADAERKTFVELVFLHRGQEYRIVRNPKYLRPKKRKTGNAAFTVETESAALGLPDGSVIAGSGPVTKKIREVLGYDYRQFKQISMIAQGEFTKLLNASASEKTQIFREIFGTVQLGRMDRILRKQAADLAEKRSRALSFCDSYILEFETDREEWIELTGQRPMHYGRIREFLERGSKRDAELLKTRRRRLASLREERRILQKELALSRELKKLESDYEQALGRKEELLAQADEMKSLQRELRLAQRAENIRPFQSACAVLEGRRDSLEAGRQALEKEIGEEEERFAALARDHEMTPLWEREREKVRRLLEKTLELKELHGRLAELEEAMDRERELYQAQYMRMKEKRRIYEELEERFKKAAAGILSKSLTDGEPCPVCGSRSHPSPALLTMDVPEEAQVEQSRAAADDARLKCEEVYRRLAEQKGKEKILLQSLRALKEELSGEELTGEELTGEELSKEEISIEWAAASGRLTERLTELENRLGRTREEYEALKLKLEGKKALLQNTLEQAGRVAGELIQAGERYREEREKNGFRSQAAYLRALREKKEILSGTERLRDYQEEQARVRESIKILKRRIGNRKSAGDGELEARDGELEAQEKELDRGLQRLVSRLEQEKRLLRVLAGTMETIAGTEREYGIVKDLSNLVGGQNSRNLVFEQYVLASYFEDILAAANLRMERMSMGRYELSRAANVADGRSKDNLEIQVLDHYTGKYRSVKTLSGGEAFKAALSLALGLSDMIQLSAGGVEVDALFIDEGFGALDSESLEQAVHCLAGLSGNERLIGIISHVEELKERIDNQIAVEKTSRGSHIHIVS